MAMNGKGLAALIIAKKKPASQSSPEGSDEDTEMGLRDAAQEVMEAIRANDVDGLMEAMKSFHQQCALAEESGEY